MLKSASGKLVQAANPMTYLDAKSQQGASKWAKHHGNNINDHLDVLMAQISRGETKLLDITVIKATIQKNKPPKEKHVAVLKMACAGAAPRMQVRYTIHQLAGRLDDKPSWLVALKTLVVFHRLMREVDPSFQDELLNYQMHTGRHRLLRLDSFADHTTKGTWDTSAWIRVYSVYLDDRLAAYKTIRYDPEAHNAVNAADFCRLDTCPANELLDKLPVVQKLLGRLISCVPEGKATLEEVPLYAAALVLREVRTVYRNVSEGIINLTDKFFDMERADALRGLDIFKENMQINERMNVFFGAINSVAALRGAAEMPVLQSLPPDFLQTMEEYVRDAPRNGPNPAKAGPTGAGANTLPSAGRASTVARQGGTTSNAITGGLPAEPEQNGNAAPPSAPAPAPEPPKPEPPAPPPPPPNAIDLLGDDYPTPSPPMPPAQPSFAMPPPYAGPTGGFGAPGMPPYAGPTGGYGAPPPFAGPTGGYGAPPPFAGPTGGMAPPFAGPTGASNPWAGLSQPAALPPPASGGFGFEEPAPFGGAPPPAANNQLATFNPFGGVSLPPSQPDPNPAFGGTSQVNPYGGLSMPPALPPPASQPYSSSTGVNPFGGVAPMGGAPFAGPTGFEAANPFDAPPASFSMPPPAAPQFGQSPQQQQHWGSNPWGASSPPAPSPQAAANTGWNTTNPTLSAQRQAHDPLRDLSFDLFGQPQQTVPPSLKDLRVSGAM